MNSLIFRRVFIVIALLNALIPVICWWLTKRFSINLNLSGMITACHEFICSLCVGCILLKYSQPFWMKFLSLSFFSVGVADLTYGITSYLLRIPPPRGLVPLLHEIPYAIFSISSATAVFLRAIEDLKSRENRFVLLFMMIVALGMTYCSYQMILVPFFSSPSIRPTILYLTATIYAVGQAFFLAGLIITSLRSVEFKEYFFWFSLLVLVGTDFALRYQDIGGPIPQLGYFEYGWNLSIASIASLIGFAFFYNTSKKTKPHESFLIFSRVSNLSSIRVITSSVALISLLGFLSTTWFCYSFLSIATPGNVGSQFIILTFAWAFANSAAILLSRIITKRSASLVNNITNVQSLEDLNYLPAGPPELNTIVTALHDMKQKLQKSIIENIQLKSAAAVGIVASQVSHDIRSPLAALEMVVLDINSLSEDKRVLIRGAVSRIKDIANNLLQINRDVSKRNYTNEDLSSGSHEKKVVQLIPSLVEKIVTEKRMQLRSKIGVEIQSTIDVSAYGAFAFIQPSELKRVISNLIDNAAETIGEVGKIDLVLKIDRSCINIFIKDTGNGISPEILKRIGHRGETHGKKMGTGLGIYHARLTIESWGGQFKIESIVGKGTTVIISIPIANSPSWFVEKISIPFGGTVVILDDDTSIHNVWTERLNILSPAENEVKVLHFSTPAELKNWCENIENRKREVIYLSDYELLGEKETGLDLIFSLGISSKSILVTSYFEENFITEAINRFKIRLIPKPMASFVPIEISPPATICDAVLLDDDNFVHTVWESSARQNDKILKSFYESKSFFEGLKTIERKSSIYVDSSLGDGVHGEQLIPIIKNMGFQRVFIATGYDRNSFAHIPGISGIVGKEPPVELVFTQRR